jgi:2-polyprenyl-6-methoxyphenol hydroxylase-like FAD-dependent oxidoreductase
MTIFSLPLFVVVAAAAGDTTAMFDCCIIGAGPAGLATAYGLRKVLGKKAKIGIFEQSSKLQQVGGQVGLMKVAFRALEALDPCIAKAITKASMAGYCFQTIQYTRQVGKGNEIHLQKL